MTHEDAKGDAAAAGLSSATTRVGAALPAILAETLAAGPSARRGPSGAPDRLAIGALIASAGNKHRCDGDRDDDRRCYDRRYQDGYNGGGYYNGYPAQGGYYNNGGGYYAQNGYYNGGRGYYEGRRHHDHDDDRGYRGY